MEILITTISAITLLLVLVLILRQSWGAITRNVMQITVSVLLVLLVLSFLALFYDTPGSDIGAEQPIPFSHRVHAGVKNIQCQYCHPYVGYSRHPGLPPVEKCLHCHNYIISRHPWILKEHEYYNTGTPTPWVKANYLAEHVLFNHQRHIRKEIACKECHGLVENQDRVKGKTFYMGFCIECHRARNANLDCWLACHS
jgi:hypothetical protein